MLRTIPGMVGPRRKGIVNEPCVGAVQRWPTECRTTVVGTTMLPPPSPSDAEEARTVLRYLLAPNRPTSASDTTG
eukprot:scaffold185962_cov32-Tisochrysis_lutea.AAC.3